MTASRVVKDLKALGSAGKAKTSAWFLKTGKGEYGYGDVFIGVSVPEQRKIAKIYGELSLNELKKLLQNKYHECRLTALLILVRRYTRGSTSEKARIARFYISHLKYVNNWDLVDLSASHILGNYLLDKEKRILYSFARSGNLWKRRVAIVATHAFIKAGRYSDTIKITKMLLKDSHDLIHKAAGWMLREVGKRDREPLLGFLDRQAHYMPRTMLRYSIEHLGEKERKHYLGLRNRLYTYKEKSP